MTPEQFTLIQTYLIGALAPFIQFWVMIFLVAVIALAILTFFLIVTRELLSRAN